MAAESAADRLEYFDTDDFGDTATIGSTSVSGLLDNIYYEANVDGNRIESNQPVFLCRSADVSSVAAGDTVTIDSIGYVVLEVQPDGEGMTDLVLREPT